MSVIIKSNNTATRNMGTLKALGTTAIAEFDKYKARVLADGGIIKSETKTKEAFELLFSTSMYGNMNAAVSSDFGVKMNGAGVERLYSIDGHDLVAKVVGTSPLPTINSSGYLDFSGTAATTTNGVVFTTEKKHVMSKTGRFGYLVNVKGAGGAASSLGKVSGLSLHGEEVVSTSFAHITSNNVANGIIDFIIQKDPLNLTVYNAITPVFELYVNPDHTTIAFLTCPDEGKAYGFRAGATITSRDGVSFKEIATKPFYIDLGGLIPSGTTNFRGQIKDFFCFNHGTIGQIAQLSSIK